MLADDDMSRCGLCERRGVILESHVLPAFVFRWLKESSGTGFIRSGENPSRRVQDGIKLPWLCEDCERRLNSYETPFAGQIFHPYNKDQTIRVRYGGWCLKFCVSISWRVLTYIQTKTDLQHLTENQRAVAIEALKRWRGYLLDELPHPGQFEQHLLPLAPVESSTFPNLPNNINRYFLRAVDMDIAGNDVATFTYSKIGRFAIFGIIRPMANARKGTRVSVKKGYLKPSKFVLPIELSDYLAERSRKYGEIGNSIPSHQLEKIETDIAKNVERFRASEEFSAMLHDERLFGIDAIIRKPKT